MVLWGVLGTLGMVSPDTIRGGTSHGLQHILQGEAQSGAIESVSPYEEARVVCEYYTPKDTASLLQNNKNISIFHINCQSLASKFDKLLHLLADLDEVGNGFDILCMSETFNTADPTTHHINGYHSPIFKVREKSQGGGVGLYIKDHLSFKIRDDLTTFIPYIIETLFVEIVLPNGSNCLVGVLYRSPNGTLDGDAGFFNKINFILDKIETERLSTYLCGDFNLNLLNRHQRNSNDFLNSMLARGFLPLITWPTRFQNDSATLIDHIYTNTSLHNKTFNSGIIPTDISDHFPIFCITSHNRPKTAKKQHPKRSFNKNKTVKFAEILAGLDFSETLNASCPNTAYNTFLKQFLTAFDTSFPKQNFSSPRKYVKRQPWITRGLVISSSTKNRLYRKMLKYKTETNIQKYKTYKKIYERLIKQARCSFFSQNLDINKKNSKKTWEIMNLALNKHKKKLELPDHFTKEGLDLHEPKEIANQFNSFFAMIGQQTSDSVPPSTKTFNDFLSQNHPNSIYMDPVSQQEIIKTALSCKPKNSSGDDEIPSVVVRDIIQFVAVPLTHIFNLSLSKGIVPEKMKIAKVVPIFKAKDRHDFNNYRPISLLPCFSKLLEKIVYKRLISFLNRFKIIYRNQYGFRRKHSTIHPIIQLLNQISQGLDSPHSEITMGLFLDLSKAFDTVDHQILLAKLNHYGIRGPTNDWFKSYLSGRSQFVTYKQVNSDYKTTSCGVPQGSILGPLLFLIYTNDLALSTKMDIYLFADDTTAITRGKNSQDLYDEVNRESACLCEWFNANKLALNVSKSRYSIFHPKQRNVDTDNCRLLINGMEVLRASPDTSEKSVKFLGVQLDEHLSWKPHINKVNSKIACATFAISKVKHILPEITLKTLYHALILPHLEYGLLAWGGASSSALKKTQKIQKRALRIITKHPFRAPTNPQFFSQQLLKLDDLYKFHAASFVWDWNNKLLPEALASLYTVVHAKRETMTSTDPVGFHLTLVWNQLDWSSLKNSLVMPSQKFGMLSQKTSK